MPSISQQSSLATALKNGLRMPFDPLFELTQKITEKQYRFLWALILKKDGDQLRRVLPELMKFYQIKQEHEQTNQI